MPIGVNLLYEVIVDQTTSGTMRFETNIDGHGSAESWIQSPGPCGYTTVTSLSSLGLPNNAWVMSVLGTIVVNPPIINCPGDILTNTDSGQCGAIVTFPDATVSTNINDDSQELYGSVTITQTMGPPSGSLFPVGETIIEFTATNQGGSDSCQFTITVEDNELPTVICQDITIPLDTNGNASIIAGDIDNGSTDNCDVDTITVNTTSFSCSDIGVNSVILTITDVNGNASSCTATVTVEDLIAPVVACHDITVALDANGNASIIAEDIDNGSTDNCGVDTITVDTTSFSCSDIGVNSVILTINDVNGNASSCTATVTVEDLNSSSRCLS